MSDTNKQVEPAGEVKVEPTEDDYRAAVEHKYRNLMPATREQFLKGDVFQSAKRNRHVQTYAELLATKRELENSKILNLTLIDAAAKQDANSNLPLKQFVWDGRGAYKMIVHAANVAEARELAKAELEMFGGASETSPVGRAHRAIAEDMPHIYHRANAEFVVTENGETEELNELLEAQDAKRKSAEAALAECQRDRDALRKALIDSGRICGAVLADNVSVEFLTHVPEEINLYIARLRSKGEKENACE